MTHQNILYDLQNRRPACHLVAGGGDTFSLPPFVFNGLPVSGWCLSSGPLSRGSLSQESRRRLLPGSATREPRQHSTAPWVRSPGAETCREAPDLRACCWTMFGKLKPIPH